MHDFSSFAGVLAQADGASAALIVFVAVFCGLLVLSKAAPRGRIWKLARHKRQQADVARVVPAAPAKPSPRPSTNIADPKEQLAAVSRVGFERRRLLNREEVPVLRLLEQTVREANAGYRVMAQTSLGEIIRPKPNSGTDEELQLAFRSINSKRLDFAIFDRFGQLVVAVEYQGSGHYHETSFMRDAVKQEALRKAGVEVIAIQEGFRATEVLPRLRRALGMSTVSEVEARQLLASGRAA